MVTFATFNIFKRKYQPYKSISPCSRIVKVVKYSVTSVAYCSDILVERVNLSACLSFPLVYIVFIELTCYSCHTGGIGYYVAVFVFLDSLVQYIPFLSTFIILKSISV